MGASPSVISLSPSDNHHHRHHCHNYRHHQHEQQPVRRVSHHSGEVQTESSFSGTVPGRRGSQDTSSSTDGLSESLTDSSPAVTPKNNHSKCRASIPPSESIDTFTSLRGYPLDQSQTWPSFNTTVEDFRRAELRRCSLCSLPSPKCTSSDSRENENSNNNYRNSSWSYPLPMSTHEILSPRRNWGSSDLLELEASEHKMAPAFVDANFNDNLGDCEEFLSQSLDDSVDITPNTRRGTNRYASTSIKNRRRRSAAKENSDFSPSSSLLALLE